MRDESVGCAFAWVAVVIPKNTNEAESTYIGKSFLNLLI
jgi:hypothetical protein